MHKYGVVLLLALVVAVTNAFILPSATPQSSSRRSSTQMRAGREQDSSRSMERRGLLRDSVGKMLGLSALVLGGANLMGAPQRAQAAVGEGTCREWEGRTMERGSVKCMGMRGIQPHTGAHFARVFS